MDNDNTNMTVSNIEDSTPKNEVLKLGASEVSNPLSLNLGEPLTKWLSKHTGYKVKKQGEIHITKAEQYFGYRLRATTITLDRKFEDKLYRTQERRNRDGEPLDRSCLWTFKDELLDFSYLKQNNKAKDLILPIPETESIISCPQCHEDGKVTCKHCDGDGEVECSKCGGSGEITRTYEVTCPRCRGTKVVGGRPCPECRIGLSSTFCRGTVKRTRQINCPTCGGRGQVKCSICRGRGEVECPSCKGIGHVQHIWNIVQDYIERYDEHEYKDSGYSDLLERIPEREEIGRENIKSWQCPTGAITNDVTKDIQGNNMESKIAKAITEAVDDIPQGQRLIAERADLYKACHYVKLAFEYAGQTYYAWVDYVDNKRIYEFQADGYCASWKRAKKKYYEKRNFFHKLKPGRIDYLKEAPVPLSEGEKAALSNELTPLKGPKSRSASASPGQKGNIEVGKSRNWYILWALIFPGVHNLYAGYKVRGIIQLLLMLTGMGMLLACPWAFIEAIVVKKDGAGDAMKTGSFWKVFLLWLLGIFALGYGLNMLSDENQEKPDASTSSDQANPSELLPPTPQSAVSSPQIDSSPQEQPEALVSPIQTGESTKIDMGSMLTQQKAEEMENEDIARKTAMLVYALSPEHYMHAELISLANGNLFELTRNSDGSINITAWVQVSFDGQKFSKLMETFHNVFESCNTPSIEIDRSASISVLKGELESYASGNDKGDFAASFEKPNVFCFDVKKITPKISGWDYTVLMSGTRSNITSTDKVTAYHLNDRESGAYVLVDILRGICGQHGFFPFGVTMHLQDKNKQELASIKRNNLEVRNYGQPIFGYPGTGGMFMIEPCFYGGSVPVGHSEDGTLLFPSRIIRLSSSVRLSSEMLQMVDSVSFSFECPSFKLSEGILKRYAERIIQAEKHDEAVKKEAEAQAQPVKITYGATSIETSTKSPDAETESVSTKEEAPTPAAPIVLAPDSMTGKRIRFIYSDTRYRDGIYRGGAFSWNAWQDRDLSRYSGWVALAAPPKLMFAQGNKGIYNPGDGSEDDYIGFILAGTYQAGQGNTASIRRELTYSPDSAGDASGEYVLTFDTPTSGTAELKNCARGESCFECENIKFVIEEISEEDLNPHTEDTSAEGGLSEAEKAELQDFLESLIMISSRSSSTTKLYQSRLLMLLPMIQEGSPVDVTTVETKGNTALHYACGMGRVDIVEWLVNHGADVNKQTDKGATPLDCVSGGYNAAEIRRILTQHGATKGKKGRR